MIHFFNSGFVVFAGSGSNLARYALSSAEKLALIAMTT